MLESEDEPNSEVFWSESSRIDIEEHDKLREQPLIGALDTGLQQCGPTRKRSLAVAKRLFLGTAENQGSTTCWTNLTADYTE